ncbi:Fe-S cluster assembly protein SufD [Simkania sp.]|uniref:Fe-S cluster assembly protein SufD n=1 Tax=Simkania sp. TaxID=34094 RepID=UPI003B528C89
MTFSLKKDPIPVRKDAWEKWGDFPSRKVEAFRYVSLKKLKEQDFTAPSPEFDYDAPSGLIVLPLEEAYKTYGPLLEKRAFLQVKKEKDPFFFLNLAVGTQGLFIYMPPDVRIEKPLEIIQKIHTAQSALCPRIEIFVGKGAELTTTFAIESDTPVFWNNMVLNVTVEEGGFYKHFDQAMGHAEAWDFLSFQGELKQNANLKFFSFGRGAQVQRRDLAISLEGEQAEADLKGMSLLDEKREGHVHIRIDHAAPNARSNQFFKHVLSDRARSSFEGKIFVEQEAQQTEAYQLNNNLILSEKAAAFSKPNLEIFADDVKASHGATVSKPNMDELFYLRSRGLSQDAARDHLVRGFCRELLQDVNLPDLYDKFSGEIHAYLSR